VGAGELPYPPQLREQLWLWLDAVVGCLVTEYVWEVADTIPACWPQHPHLVREIAVLADQRRRAGHAFTSDALEEWHRYSLATFTERMKSRLRTSLPWDQVRRGVAGVHGWDSLILTRARSTTSRARRSGRQVHLGHGHRAAARSGDWRNDHCCDDWRWRFRAC
jgi:hypothetical protein